MFDIQYFRKDPRPFFKFAKEIYPGETNSIFEKARIPNILFQVSLVPLPVTGSFTA